MKKGKGYLLVESDKSGVWYGIGFYKIEFGDFIKDKNVLIVWSKLVSDMVLKMVREDDCIVVVMLVMFVGLKFEVF